MKYLKNIKKKIILLAELENTISRLNKAINKVTTRSNALKDIIIPNDKKIEHEIKNILEKTVMEEETPVTNESENIFNSSNNIFNSEPTKEEKTETLDLMAENPKNEPDVKKEETQPSPGFNLFNFSNNTPEYPSLENAETDTIYEENRTYIDNSTQLDNKETGSKINAGYTVSLPASFKVSANDNLQKNGIIILDKNNNEFVWIPCMKLINSYSGHSIGVYNPETKDKRKVYKMMEDKRIKYYTPADYTEGSELDELVKTIINTTASNEKLMSIHYQNKQEQVSHNGQPDNQEDKEKEKLIMDLENSNSFKQTHSIISKLKKIKDWTLEEKIQLRTIAEKNTQIYSIMKDGDVASFYSSLE